MPILTEEDGRKYFDANLIGKNIVAVHLNILNFSSDVAEFAESNLTINNSILTQLSVEDVYRVIRREYTAKAIAWLSITYGVGGPILAAHTAGINKRLWKICRVSV